MVQGAKMPNANPLGLHTHSENLIYIHVQEKECFQEMWKNFPYLYLY